MKFSRFFMNSPLYTFFLIALIGLTFASCDMAESSGPPMDLPPQASADPSNNPSAVLKPGDIPIAQIAIDEGLTELVDAITYVDAALEAGLLELFMDGTDQYTVFAPTNDAFQALYDSDPNVSGITDLPAELVLSVLYYHVTEGRRASNSVLPPKEGKLRTIETLLEDPDTGEYATFGVNSDGEIFAIGSTANITVPDQSASNGIVHIIDAVLMPQ